MNSVAPNNQSRAELNINKNIHINPRIQCNFAFLLNIFVPCTTTRITFCMHFTRTNLIRVLFEISNRSSIAPHLLFIPSPLFHRRREKSLSAWRTSHLGALSVGWCLHSASHIWRKLKHYYSISDVIAGNEVLLRCFRVPWTKNKKRNNTPSPRRTPLLLSALTKHSWDSSEHEHWITVHTSSSFTAFWADGWGFYGTIMHEQLNN